ncbi:MAG TPA: polysaccharide deacetylase family protein [Gemmatimonadaceae bacterium]
MRPLFSISTLFLLFASTLPLAAQTRTLAERLGYPANAKLLILHADDIGVAHSQDSATFAALDAGAVSSTSAMVPTPWITEVAAYAKTHPDADIGLHLTLTSEWDTYKWGSVAPRDSVPSLYDSTGYLPNDVPPVVAHAKPQEVERELRAQIDRALALGIHPSHVDSHMGALFSTPELIATYVKVARSYHLPYLSVKSDPRSAPSDMMLDAVIVASPDVPRDHWMAFYTNAVAQLKPGVSEIIVHLAHDDSEMRAVTVNHEPYGAAWRQRDFDVVTSAEFRKALQANHVTLIKWRDIQKAMAQP